MENEWPLVSEGGWFETHLGTSGKPCITSFHGFQGTADNIRLAEFGSTGPEPGDFHFAGQSPRRAEMFLQDDDCRLRVVPCPWGLMLL